MSDREVGPGGRKFGDQRDDYDDAFGDQRDDYDDAFATRWTPWERARHRVLGPAVALVVIGTLGVIGSIFGLVALLGLHLQRALNGWPRAEVALLVGLPLILLGLALSVVMIAGGVDMQRLRRRRLALFAAYVVTGLSLAGPYGILFYPFGIWGLVVLYRPDVREQFGRPPRPRDDRHGEL